MARLEIHADYQSLFQQRGWNTVASFLSWTGLPIQHPTHRQVEQVTLEPEAPIRDVLFLRKEHAVTWRERFRNAWDGFGWCSNAVREASLLKAARQAGGPEVIAFGEDRSRAFVLLREEAGMAERRTGAKCFEQAFAKASLTLRRCLLQQAGQIVRRIHEAGYRLPPGDTWARRLGVVAGTSEVLLTSVEPLIRSAGTWQEIAPREFNRPQILLSRTEQLRFLGAYLRPGETDASKGTALSPSGRRAVGRQAAA